MTKRYRLAVRGVLPALFSVALFAMTGCEWEGSGSDDFWSERYDYMNFSGVYRPAPGRDFIVHSFEGPAGVDVGQRTVADREIAVGDGVATVLNGVLTERPIVPGSVSIVAGGYQIADADGSLLGSGASGNINYQTGAWSIDFGAPLSAGTPVIGAWRFDPSEDTTSVPGSTKPIYQLTVQHTGNRVTLIDNAGHRYEGRLGSVDTDGSFSDDGNSEQRVSFHAEGMSNGQHVEIVGAFQALVRTQLISQRDEEGNVIGQVATPMVVTRSMTGTWVEPSGKIGRINAVGPDGQR